MVWRLALVTALLIGLAACRSDAPGNTSAPGVAQADLDCGAEPLPPIEAFLRGETERVRRFQATLSSVDPVADSGHLDLVLEADGGTQVLRIGDPGFPFPIEAGAALKFTVEVAPGFPSSSSVVMEDARGLRFASVADQSLGSRVLLDGLPDLELKVVDLECDARASSRCFESLVNMALSIGYNGRETLLVNGQAATIGPYRVLCRVAQKVVYTRNCADAGIHGLSFVVVRGDGMD